MINNNFTQQIKEYITSFEPGTAFVPSDFLDIADLYTVNVILSRLTNSSYLNRLIRGVYCYCGGNKNSFIEPDPLIVAQAIARSNSWTIVPTKDTALYILGLSDIRPLTWVFATNGPYRRYRVKNYMIQFKKVSNKDIIDIDEDIALIIQALKVIGKNKLTDNMIYKLKNIFSQDEKKRLLEQSKNSTYWIRQAIKNISEV